LSSAIHHGTSWLVLHSENLKKCALFFSPPSTHCLCVNGLYWIFALS